jgi:hypothetical protein
MKVVKPDVMSASGSLQLCAGQPSGSEAAIHAMRNISMKMTLKRSYSLTRPMHLIP